MTPVTVRWPTTTTTYELPAEQVGEFVASVLGDDQAAALAALEAAGMVPEAIAAVPRE